VKEPSPNKAYRTQHSFSPHTNQLWIELQPSTKNVLHTKIKKTKKKHDKVPFINQNKYDVPVPACLAEDFQLCYLELHLQL
jgi:hypothetical protein